VTSIEVISYGILGGMLPELLGLYRLRHTNKNDKPEWLRSVFYWVVTFTMVLLGGGTAFVYHKIGINVNELAAIHLGAATPLIISSLEKRKPHIS